MKRYVAFLLCLISVFSLCSCNIYEKFFPIHVSSDPTVSTETTPSEATSNPQETTTDPQEVTTEPQEVTTKPQETTSESEETTTSKGEPVTPESMYRSFLNGEEKVLVGKTGEYVCLGDYVPDANGISLAKCETLLYIYYDVDGNGIKDVAIDCGNEKLYLTYENGIVTLKTLSSEIWKEIEEEDYWYVYDILSLAAPWREVVMSREEIKAIASYVWRIEDGEGTGACGTFYVFRIVVSDESDENGYYLVTQKYEEYKWCDWEDCVDAEVSHQHLYDIVDDYYMLVHERTGEIIQSRITIPRAKWKASLCWNTYDGYEDYAAGNICVTRIEVANQSEYANGEMYYHVIWKIEYYSQDDETEPYYTYDFKHLYVHAQTGECYLYPDINAPTGK